MYNIVQQLSAQIQAGGDGNSSSSTPVLEQIFSESGSFNLSIEQDATGIKLNDNKIHYNIYGNISDVSVTETHLLGKQFIDVLSGRTQNTSQLTAFDVYKTDTDICISRIDNRF